jgi:hypothetical protein
MTVYENIKKLSPKAQQNFIWDKIIYANPTKPKETLLELDKYKPLVTYDNVNELKKIRQYAPHAGVVLRLGVANTGSQCELSNKFGCHPGEAVDLILAAFKLGLTVEGLSFHVGSQCTNFENFVQALNTASAVMRESKSRGHELKILDIMPKSNACSPETFRYLPSRDVFWWQLPRPPWRALLAKPCATAKHATTLTTASITRSAELFLTIANIT